MVLKDPRGAGGGDVSSEDWEIVFLFWYSNTRYTWAEAYIQGGDFPNPLREFLEGVNEDGEGDESNDPE